MTQDLDDSRTAARSPTRLMATAVFVCMALAGCASPTVSVPEPVSEEDLPALRETLRQDPGNREIQGWLAASLLQAGRCDEAARIASQAVASPFDSWPTLVRGRCLEEAGLDQAALEVYQDYLGTYDEQRGAAPARGRVLLVQRRLAMAQARDALRDPPTEPGSSSTVAVLPFRIRGADDLEPVGRTLARRFSTDLAEVEGLEVVDPLVVELALDRFGTPGAFGLDSAQAVRFGQSLGAGQVVQGLAYLDTTGLNRLSTRITSVDRGDGEGARVEGSLDDIPRLEKELALQTARALGRIPSPDERTRILYRGPRDLASLRAYGEGLDLQREGAYAEAAPRFAETVRLDPEFEEARRALEASAAVAVLGEDGPDNVLTATPTVAAAVEAALRPVGAVDPLRLAIMAGTSDVSATQGERVTGVVAATSEEGSVGSIQNLDAPALLTPAQITGLIRIIVVVPGG